MFAETQITEAQAAEAACEVGQLNLWRPDVKAAYIGAGRRVMEEWGNCPGFFLELLPALRAADELARAGTRSAEESFDVRFDVENGSVSYVGQFTQGRWVEVSRRDDGCFYIAAETGTDRPSKYFASFACLWEHLPKLCA